MVNARNEWDCICALAIQFCRQLGVWIISFLFFWGGGTIVTSEARCWYLIAKKGRENTCKVSFPLDDSTEQLKTAIKVRVARQRFSPGLPYTGKVWYKILTFLILDGSWVGIRFLVIRCELDLAFGW